MLMQKKWTPEEIQHLKDINPIAIVAGELGLQVVKGRARCIFPENHSHGDRTPSMSINSNSGSFKCWVCDAVYGDVIKLVMLVKRCNFVDALGWLNERTPVHSITADLKTGPISQKTHATIHFDMDLEYRSAIILDFLKLLKPVDGQALKYLNSRKRV